MKIGITPMFRTIAVALAVCMTQPAAIHAMTIGPLPRLDAIEAVPVLYANRGTLWANAGRAKVDIDVCWVNPNAAPGATPAERAAWGDLRRRAVEEWSRYARINFRGWDGADPVDHPTVCNSRAPGLHVVICNLPTDARCPALPKSQSEPGGYPKNNGLSNGVRLNPQHGPRVATHEFGHTLGLYHEEERPDAPAIASGPCKKQSWPNDQPLRYGAYDRTGVMSYCQPAGAAPWLSPNDIVAIQRLYGRRRSNSLLTPRGTCAGARAGDHAHAVIGECDESVDTTLIAVAGGSKGDAWNLRLGAAQGSPPRCLAGTGAAENAEVQAGGCDAGTEWRFQDTYVQGFGGLCLDVRAGTKAAGTLIQTWRCGALGGANQRWTRTRAGQLQYVRTNFCAQAGPAGQLALATCDANDGAQIFRFSAGEIRRVSTGGCLQVRGPSDAEYVAGAGLPANGSAIEESACNASLAQRWNFSGALRYGANPDLCLARRADAHGSSLHLANCRNGSELQVWDYHF
jgi:Ricin-type beta-trefoil lectin domain